jgi:MoaA/NifB/PqqE/SkfB family radical SAM enzyme
MTSTAVHKLRAGWRLFGVGVRLPAYLLFFVTHRCDAKCGHCFFWRQLNDRSFRELELAEINTLAKSLGPVLQVTLTGGSPELRHDLPRIAEAFHRHCRPTNLTLCFNGYHTERIVAHMREIFDRCPGQRFTTGVSLDGLGEVHERIRGMPGLFERVVRTVHELHRLKVETGRLQVVCAICVSELNHASAEDTARWVWEHLPVDVVKPILVRGEPQNPRAIGQQAVEAYLRLVKSQRPRLQGPQGARRNWFQSLVAAKESVQRDLICRIAQTGQSPVRCSATFETAVIYANGNVAGCELRDEVLGNLRDVGMDFKQLWHATAASRFRQGVRCRQCTCYHHCFLAPMIFRSPRFWLPLWQSLAGGSVKSEAQLMAATPES